MMQVTENSNIKDIIKDTITLLCKNGLNYEESCSIEALIGITLDKSNVILLNLNEVIELQGKGKKGENELNCSRKRSSVRSSDGDQNEYAQPKKRKANRHLSTDNIPDPNDASEVNFDDVQQSNNTTVDMNCALVKTEPPSTMDFVNITPDSTGHAPSFQYQPVFPTSLPLHNNTLPTGHSPYDFEPSPTTFSPKKTTGKDLVCSLCFQVFKFAQSFRDHQRNRHGIGEPFLCPCGEKIMDRRKFQKHRKYCTGLEKEKTWADHSAVDYTLPDNADISLVKADSNSDETSNT